MYYNQKRRKVCSKNVSSIKYILYLSLWHINKWNCFTLMHCRGFVGSTVTLYIHGYVSIDKNDWLYISLHYMDSNVFYYLFRMLQSSPDSLHSHSPDGGPEFAEVFVIVWVGALIVTLNSKLLGGNMWVCEIGSSSIVMISIMKRSSISIAYLLIMFLCFV